MVRFHLFSAQFRNIFKIECNLLGSPAPSNFFSFTWQSIQSDPRSHRSDSSPFAILSICSIDILRDKGVNDLNSSGVSAKSIFTHHPGLSHDTIEIPYCCSQIPLDCDLYQACNLSISFIIIKRMPRVSSVPGGAGVSTRLFRRAARRNKTLIALGIPADAQRRQER